MAATSLSPRPDRQMMMESSGSNSFAIFIAWGYCMGTLDRTDDTLGSCEVFKSFYCLIVRYRNVFGAADVMQICMLRSNARVVKACRKSSKPVRSDRIYPGRSRISYPWKTPSVPGCNGCCSLCGVDAASCCLASNQADIFVIDEVIEHTHRIASAADACHDGFREFSFFFEDLLSCLFADDSLEIADDGRGTDAGP